MISHKWVNTQEITSGLGRYYPFFRILVCFGVIDILRNNFDNENGIYLVGEENLIWDYAEQIIKVIKSTEEVSNKKTFLKEKKKNPKIHKSFLRAKFKDKWIKEICYIAQAELRALKEMTPKEFYELRKHSELRKQYIMQTPSLKILKTFKCQGN